MSKQATHQILSGSNVSQFLSYMTVGSKAFGLTPTSASLKTETYSSGGISYVSNPNSLSTQLLNAGSSSLDVSEIIALYDTRLNPDLYKKYQLNYALSTGSTFNEAVMWADRNS